MSNSNFLLKYQRMRKMTKKYDFAIVSGGFDPVHVGHLKMFQDAKNLSDNVVLLLNNDEWLIKKRASLL